MQADDRDYETCSFPEAAEALSELKRQHAAGEQLVWTGLDRLHHSIAATCPSPSELVSGLEYWTDRGHSFDELVTMIAFQLGWHNGVVRESRYLP